MLIWMSSLMLLEKIKEEITPAFVLVKKHINGCQFFDK